MNDNNEEEEVVLYTSGDAAKLLRITPQAIIEAARAKRIQVYATTAGGIRLFRREDIDAYNKTRRKRNR